MLRLPPFRLLRPRTLAEAARLLVEEGAAHRGPAGAAEAAGGAGAAGAAWSPGPVRLVAGGTDLWPNMKRRHQRAETVVSLMGVAELAGIREDGTDGDGGA